MQKDSPMSTTVAWISSRILQFALLCFPYLDVYISHDTLQWPFLSLMPDYLACLLARILPRLDGFPFLRFLKSERWTFTL